MQTAHPQHDACPCDRPWGCRFCLRNEPRSDGEDANVVERFKVASDGDALLLPVTFQGKTYQFLLDTGALAMYSTRPCRSAKRLTRGWSRVEAVRSGPSSTTRRRPPLGI